MFRTSLILFLAATFSPAAPLLEFQPSAAAISPGQTINLDLRVTGVSDLYAFQFDFAFDPVVLEFVGVSEGSIFGGLSSDFLPGFESSPGLVEFNGGTLLGPEPGVSGDGTLARITVRGLLAGTSMISLTQVSLLDSTLFPLEATLGSASVTVGDSIVPEPATFVPAALALLGIGALRRWRRAR